MAATLKLSLERNIRLGFAVALASVIAAGAATLWSAAATGDSARWVGHALGLRRLTEIQLLFSDAEAGARGYAFTGDTAFLAPYASARSALPALVQQLRTITADNPSQRHRADSLAVVVPAGLDQLGSAVALRRSDTAAPLGQGQESRIVMDRISGLIGRMRDDEQRQLGERSASLQAQTRTARLAAWVGSLLAITVVAGANFLIVRELGGGRRAEATSQSVVESVPSGIVMIDRGGRIVLVNQETERLFGYSRDEILGQPIERLVPQRCRGGHSPFRPESLADPQSRAMGVGRDLYGVRKDGVEVPVEIGLNPLQTSEGQFVLASVVDISARKQAEDELRRSNEELERFAYVASHNLQEPLRMVGNYVQLLAKRYQGKLDADADEFIGYALDGELRMQQLIEDLLAYSQVGTQGAAMTPTDTDAVVKTVLSSLKLTIEESGGTVTHGPLPSVSADRGQLELLFLNLVSNAVKFRGADPPRVHISAAPSDVGWRFRVQDNGIGIAAQYFDSIFVIFQRLHGRERYGGTGLGLAIAKKIVERHGGRIGVESEPGRGTTFFFTLPASSEA